MSATIDDLMAQAARMGITIREERIPGSRLGEYLNETRTIRLDERMNDNQRLCTLQHELIHAEHFEQGLDLLGPEKEEAKTRRETAQRLVDPEAYALAEQTYDASAFKIAAELGLTVAVVEDYRRILEIHPELCRNVND